VGAGAAAGMGQFCLHFSPQHHLERVLSGPQAA
jgi:hypothetical protein